MRQRLLFPLLFILGAAFPAVAQFVPQGFNYQSIVRNNNGDPLTNQTVTLLFSIRSGAPNGPVSYSEKQSSSTNEFGLITLIIGQGTPLQGDFATINWSGGAKYLTVSIETTPGVFDELGSSQLMSVPYAIYAGSAGNSDPNLGDNWGTQVVTTNTTLNGNGTGGNPLGLAQQNAQAGQVLKWNGNAWAPSDDISGISGSGGTVTQINTGAGLTGGPISTSGTISLSGTGVTPGAYGSASQIPVVTVDALGRVTSIFTTVASPGNFSVAAGGGVTVQQNGTVYTVSNAGDINAGDDITIASQADGDVSGPFSNLQIKANAVNSAEIADNAVGTSELGSNAVTTAKISNGAVTAAKLDNMSATNGQVLKWNGTAWAPAADLSGSITLNAGTGISVTGSSPNYTVTNTGDTNAADDITTASTANGDVSGPFSNLQIKNDVITTAELANGAVETANVANGAITAAKIDDMSATNGQVLKWNGTAWAPAADQGGTFNVLAGTGIDVTPSGSNFIVINTGDVDASDDITTATQANGDVSGPFNNLQIKPAVVTNVELANNSVGTSNLINGAVTGAKINNMSAGIGQVIKWNGTTWAPADDATSIPGLGDNWGNQTVISNATLSGAGTAGSPLGLAQQGATNGQILKWNNTLGAWLPSNENTSGDNWGTQVAKTGTALSGDGTNGSPLNLAQQGATNGQVLKWNSLAGAWVPAADGGDNWGTQTVKTSTELSGVGTTASPLKIAQQGASSGQVLKWNGADWEPGNDLTGGGGGGIVYVAGPGISITGPSQTPTISNTGDLSNTNEIQTLSLVGSNLSISGANTVDLSPLAGGSDLWKKNGNDIFNTNSQNVLIGLTNGTTGKLQVSSTGSGEAGRFVVANASADAAAIYGEHMGGGPGAYFTSAAGPALVTGVGSVGIGTDVPNFKMDVKGDGHFLGESSNAALTLENVGSDFSLLSMKNTDLGSWSTLAKGGGNNAEYGIEYNKGSGVPIRGFTAKGTGEVTIGSLTGNTTRVRLRHGDDGIYMMNNNNGHYWKFWVTNADGSLALYNDQMGALVPAGTFATNGLYIPSDSRLKKDIMAIPGGILDKMLQLEPVTYRYIVENEDAKKSIGFLAQNVQALFPELVGHSPVVDGKGGYLNLNYAGIGVLAVKAIQEQQAHIEALKQENEDLRKQMDTLEARLDRLEGKK